MKKYIVYIHINKINNKTYVGTTSKKAIRRWGKYGGGYKTQPFYNAIQQYGWDNFEHIILFEHKTEKEAKYLEELFTKILLSNDSEFGYNVAVGEYFKSRGESPNAQKVICDDKIFACIEDCADYYNINYVMMRAWLIGSNRMPKIFYNKGLNYLDNPRMINIRTDEKPNSKSVICNNITFDSITDCANFYNLHRDTVSNWLYKRVQMPEDFIKMGLRFVNEDEIFNKKMNYRYRAITSKKVICDNRMFNSIKDCADFYGVNSSTMRDWLRGKCNMRKEFQELGLRYATKEDLNTYDLVN